jgi:hypothetical protein
MGFASVTRESAIPSDMSSFIGDEYKDKLFDTEGKPIEKKPKIHSHDPTRIVYHWDPTKWPIDVNVPEEAIPSTSDLSTPDVVEVCNLSNLYIFKFFNCRILNHYFFTSL